MSFEEVDPEVIADLQLRAASEHDPTRERPTALRFEPCPTVRMLPCRNKSCLKPCELTSTGQEQLVMFNRMLLRRGEQPINEHDLLVCGDCRSLLEKRIADRARERTTEMAETVRKLKDSKNPDAEHDLWRYVDKYHPDPRGLRGWLRSRDAKGRSPSSKERM